MWKDRLGNYSLLWLTDPYSLTAGNPYWFNTPDAVPTDYSTVLEQPLVLQLSPPPNDIGMVNLITVESLPDLDPQNVATVLGIPDDYCWIIKFGVLADLFYQDGPGQDEGRAQYCQSRYDDGIKLARVSNFVRFGYQTGVPAFIDSIAELDATNPTWPSQLSGTPDSMGLAGNIALVTPIPDNTPHSLSFDITPAFPIGGPLDYVQVGREVLDIIIDYAQHLAYIKEGVLS